MKQRKDEHGDAENSFSMIGDLWAVYLKHKWARSKIISVSELTISPYDVAQMMSLLKKARAIYGDSTHADHFVDDVGYSALAAMMVNAQANPQPLTNEQMKKGLDKVDMDEIRRQGR
jgi:hypothetical protein